MPSPVSADGQKFLMVQPVEEPITEFQLARPSGK
jgi:hypothetical protein